MKIPCVYLVHLDIPLYGNKQHYIGFSKNITKRMKAHRSGHGAKFLKQANQYYVKWKLVRVWWNSDRTFERKMKSGTSKYICPICNENLQRVDLSHIDKESGL